MQDVTFIIFGVSGDLAKRYIFPAIYRLIESGNIDNFMIVGVARRTLSMQEILKEAYSFVKNGKKSIWKKIEEAAYYQQLDFQNEEHYLFLKNKMVELEQKHRLQGNRLFYLATLPHNFDVITLNIAKIGIAQESFGKWCRIVYEKPFGQDLSSAIKINNSIARFFQEQQVYRIDHYLGKELVENIAMLRFTNEVLEPLWNSSHVESVQIHFREKLGLEGRGNFYDQYGALKDVVQNHLLQITALTAMEAPQKLIGDFIRNEKAKVLKAIRVDDVLLGQYKCYLLEKDVAPHSRTETFAAIKLFINNKRWKGIPFYLITGKFLDKKEVKVDIKFKAANCRLPSCPTDTNYLTIRIQPDEGFSLALFAKISGKDHVVMPVKMDYCQECKSDFRSPEAYEVLLEDVIQGDQSLFVRQDEIELQWKIINSILKKKNVLYEYEHGSKGPKELALFEKKHNMRWRV